ncbi:MAG: hypothetical protein ACT4PM_11040 [Gemmatimonadales bacterium]
MRAGAILVLALTLAGTASAQKGKVRCTGEPADSALLADGPVYRDCEVSRPAELRTSDFPIDFKPPPAATGGVPGACYKAGFQFVVDTVGRPELPTLRPLAGNDRALEEALRPGLSQLRYEPARLGGLRVRQIVIYSRAVEPIVRVSPTDGEAVGLPSARSPTGRCR